MEAGCSRSSYLGVSIINNPQLIQFPRGAFLPSPHLRQPLVDPLLWPPGSARWDLGSRLSLRLGSWQPGGRCCCKACLGCAHVMKRGENKGEEAAAKRWLFFFFFSFKEFAASASRSFAVWARREEERERKQLSGPRGRAASRSAPRPCDSEKA